MKTREKMEKEKNIVIEGSRLSHIDRERLSELLKDTVSWEKIFEYAMRNKVLYLLVHNLHKCELDSYIPDTLIKLVEDSMRCNVLRNDIKFSELENICKKLEDNNIKIVPVKGAYMIDNIYKSRAIRTTNDIDALVQKKDISKLNLIMKELGYSCDKYDELSKSFVKRSGSERMLYKTKMYNLLPYVKIVKQPIEMKVIFDFSHSLDFSLNTEPVQEMIDASYLENNVRKTLPEYYFIHMCCHHYREASHVEWMKIGKDLNFIKFCDVREYILHKMDDISLTKAIEFAKKYHLEEPVYFVLYYLDILYGDGYEKEWMERLVIENDSFVHTFGDDSNEKKYVRKKEFWDSFFDNNNSDEIMNKPKYDEVIR